METIAITPVLLIGSALLLVFSGLHLVPSFRTSKNLRRVTYAAGLAFTGWVCALTLFGLHATIGTMAAVLETRSGADLAPLFRSWDFHKFYLGAFAILTAMFGTAVLYWRIVKRRL